MPLRRNNALLLPLYGRVVPSYQSAPDRSRLRDGPGPGPRNGALGGSVVPDPGRPNPVSTHRERRNRTTTTTVTASSDRAEGSEGRDPEASRGRPSLPSGEIPTEVCPGRKEGLFRTGVPYRRPQHEPVRPARKATRGGVTARRQPFAGERIGIELAPVDPDEESTSRPALSRTDPPEECLAPSRSKLCITKRVCLVLRHCAPRFTIQRTLDRPARNRLFTLPRRRPRRRR